MSTPSGGRLSLYYYGSCAYCLYVRSVIATLGLELELRNIHEGTEHLYALVAARGRRTVPVLRIDHDDGRTEWVGESRSIAGRLRAMVATGHV